MLELLIATNLVKFRGQLIGSAEAPYTPVTRGAVCAAGTKIYCYGGLSGTAGDVTAQFYSYDISTGTFEQLPTTPGIRAYATLVYDGTYLYLVYGRTGTSNATNSGEIWRYNITSKTWALQATNASDGRMGHDSFFVTRWGNVNRPGILITRGRGVSAFLTTGTFYDIGNKTFTDMGVTLPAFRYGGACLYKNKFYLVGGGNDVTVYDSFISCDLVTKEIQTLPKPPLPLRLSPLIPFYDELVMLGGDPGYGTGVTIPDSYVYDVIKGTWKKIPNVYSEPFETGAGLNINNKIYYVNPYTASFTRSLKIWNFV